MEITRGSNSSWRTISIITAIPLMGLCTYIHQFLFLNVPHHLHAQECLTIQNDHHNHEENASGESDQNAVYYRNALWRPHIGRWLADCDPKSSLVDIVENVFEGSCPENCSGKGTCNHEIRKCRCPLGYTGEACSERRYLECNFPATPTEPFGSYTPSVCPTHCDKTRAFCFCGEGTKYPHRPVLEQCGFNLLESMRGELFRTSTNWTSPDYDHILTTNKSKEGWCNVDPEEGYASIARFKEACDCPYDGFAGRFCEIPNMSTCINQCSGHGLCQGGFCKCEREWYGVDCSIPSSSVATKDWPNWLRSSTSDAPPSFEAHVNKTSAIVKKKRPLIYIYDLPSELDSQILEGRHGKSTCVNRLYFEDNRTMWTEDLYGTQLALYEGLLASPHRTLNGEEADYFLVPLFDSCIIFRIGDSPDFTIPNEQRRTSFVSEFYKKTYDHINKNYPFWSRSSGRDHIWFFVGDEGSCYAPKEIQTSILLSHWGNTNSKHNYSTSTVYVDNWNIIPPNARVSKACFDADKDIVLPAWKFPEPATLQEAKWRRPREERSIFFYFNGELGRKYPGERSDTTPKYSMGIRQKIAREFASSPDEKGIFGRRHAKDVIVTSTRSDDYHDELSRSIFCGVFPGDGWSGRMEDSILHGCIPVIIQDGVQLPFENVLHYESFAVRIKEEDIPNMINILRMISEAKIKSMLENVSKIWARFYYRDTVILEAERQKKLLGDVDDWGVEYSKIRDDDVFSTFIQVLHYKLHNDAWRKMMSRNHKEFGLPKECKGN